MHMLKFCQACVSPACKPASPTWMRSFWKPSVLVSTKLHRMQVESEMLTNAGYETAQ